MNNYLRNNQENYNSEKEQLNDNDLGNDENVERNENNSKEIPSSRGNRFNFTSINPASIIKLREVSYSS